MVRETQELAQIRVGLEEVLCHFRELEDPREPINIKHSLESVVVISIMGILAGAAGPTSIAEWAKSKSVFLIDLLSLGATGECFDSPVLGDQQHRERRFTLADTGEPQRPPVTPSVRGTMRKGEAPAEPPVDILSVSPVAPAASSPRAEMIRWGSSTTFMFVGSRTDRHRGVVAGTD